ncbi:metal ABC transporter substrate-binding protein [Methanoculleus taiwanensis]|uniref:Metal ABC transporter substrate-binding protein n=1 Tax=Methanoculleus taiwanensis TaxID=1550565 RepID=A0A498H0F3_9EURY|nr:metal ABC transporter substrate-binding protein [Methanoculleus taiwanensis]RXE55336.1 metal ABC transporter substrate-binding protein [Methanoculleus taiwanensis]
MRSIPIFTAVLLALLLAVPVSADLTVVSTTAVLAEPLQYIGGEKVEVMYISDPTLCPHLQQDVINNRIQLNRDFIRDADLLVAHNTSVDQAYVMPFVDDFMAANEYGSVQWTTPGDPTMTWNTPEKANTLVAIVKDWLVAADPDNRTYYEDRYASYVTLIEAADLTDDERQAISGQDVITIVWQRDAVENWLGLNVVNIYAPEHYQGGKYTAAKLVDDINANPEKYANVTYIIENMQSGELGKGVEEALNDKGIPVQRVVFTNFPKSVPGVETIPDVIVYNKGLVMMQTPATTPAPEAPVGILAVLGAVAIGLLLISRRD